ncbi:hypothetical protein ACOSP7_017633 [Xanthoceras sorbifolium]
MVFFWHNLIVKAETKSRQETDNLPGFGLASLHAVSIFPVWICCCCYIIRDRVSIFVVFIIILLDYLFVKNDGAIVLQVGGLFSTGNEEGEEHTFYCMYNSLYIFVLRICYSEKIILVFMRFEIIIFDIY